MSPTPQSDALRDALAARRRSQASDYPGTAVRIPLTTPQLTALTLALDELTRAMQRATVRAQEDDTVAVMHVTPRTSAIIRQAAGVVRDAAAFGHPAPALEQLGAQAARLPGARTTDPHTARESAETTRLTPTARNHLGKLLVGFLMYEHQEIRIAKDGTPGYPETATFDVNEVDTTLTSEEVAHRVGLGGAEFAKRCSDLLALGYIRVAQDSNGHDRTRRGDSGRQRLVFELTDDGRVMASRIHWGSAQ